ncbi:MAG: fluoride efflux transporter CrcB [Saprospiraceae bacterium]|nr:fluoride efflux transporter CrcB [Saprospiraceae bacterium]
MPSFLLVFLGGGLGSLSRWGLSLAIQPLLPKFPWATLLANALACLVMGIILQQQLGTGVTEPRRLLLAVGFCGGFSTFSTFTAETFQLWQNGQPLMAIWNILGNMVICLVCLILGMKLGWPS